MAKSGNDTPLMQQHRAIKQKYPDAVLLFRVGDFYETFGEDAIIASRVLGITLTKRNNGAAASSELAGFPHHSLETYLHKLVKAGHRVAICDQLEDPKMVKGIVKRGVTEMVTPGIATSDKMLENKSNNFLAAVHYTEQNTGIALLDISTGEFFAAEGNEEYIDKLLQSMQPAEVIFERSYLKKFKEQYGTRFYTYTMERWIFEEGFARENLVKQFNTHSLKGFGIDAMPAAIIAASAILHYLKDTEHPNLQHITQIQHIERDQFLWMDRFTIRNLELLPLHSEGHTSLLQVIDNTVSAMGARLLKRWLVFPLKNKQAIEERLEAVEFSIVQTELRQQLAAAIKACGDIERLVSKIALRKIGPREVVQLARGLEQTAIVKALLHNSPNQWLGKLSNQLDACEAMQTRINKEIQENPAVLINKGGVIAAGVNEELDHLRNIANGGKEFLVNIQEREAERTGINSLKISFNNVFGYYLEVTNSHKNKVPADWIRKQTLTNAERYITPELKEYEEKIIGAEDKILAIEQDLYNQLITDLQTYIAPIQVNGNILATLDCIICFAENALQYQYRKPVIHEGLELQIKEGRHPVIERKLGLDEQYVSNDIELNKTDQQIIILTGPNMSGKSALLRQTAIITLMAHMGSFVPAAAAMIPLTDKIFTRVGASDNLSGGESTFMVEMNETASIINNMSERSLILLDEIGRGTATYDGISIAWSMVEYIHNSPFAPKTLFATHYHELNELEEHLPRVKNYHITHKELNNKIIFLRKMATGGSTHSFGIQVAKMAGMPTALINRATAIMEQLEKEHVREEAGNNIVSEAVQNASVPKVQLSIFDAHTETFESIRAKLNAIDINQLTPVEALMKLNDIKALLK
ncbi:MAG: DNA mismatch repair protein MutS [Sediminibacterium sp.]|uniref:DNA mismatch repair protein MutS n=1 Tax=Sediminibacterium sp. TaxID=1917865 RepID=UPI00271F994D|nr:DNA mismatch repair protein MutS [Sediminibacterium sp.]MDO8997630.1 DNA mismatch repair protein MutS [Sediminibacterium sp.]